MGGGSVACWWCGLFGSVVVAGALFVVLFVFVLLIFVCLFLFC